MESSFRYLVGILLIAVLFSCSFSKIEDFEQGQNFVDSSSGVVLIDTMNTESSTVRVDSIVTSNLNLLLVGRYSNIYTGTVTCNPYFQLNGTTNPTTATDLVYDSLVVKMDYNGYYIGDTTKLMTVNVRQISQELKLNTTGYLYSTSSFQLADESLGEMSFYPRPHSKNTLYLHLTDKLGKELFQKIMDKNDTMTNSTMFMEYFKGMDLVSGERQSQVAVGFAHDSIAMRLYYHELVKVVDSNAKTYFNFPVATTDIWYNQISHNTTGSLIEQISQNKNELPCSLTQNQTMIQAGTGIYTKIRIPGIDNLKGYGKNVAFIAANLQITPLKDSYSTMNPLPDSLSIYIVDHKNMITSQFSNTQGYIYATRVIPEELDQLPYYTIDITQFFDTEISDLTISDHSLFIGAVASSNGQKINPVVFTTAGLKKEKVKLNVYCYIDKSN